MQGVSKRALQLWEIIWIYSEDMFSVLNYHNIAKYAELYVGQLGLIVTSTDNVECLKNSFTIVFQMLLFGECYENAYT
jgi:hypothetical protein